MRKYAVVIVTVSLVALLGPVALAVGLNGPPYVTTVNTLGRTLSQELGNWSPAQVNADPDAIVYDFEDAAFSAGDRLETIIMHPIYPNSPITKRIWFDYVNVPGALTAVMTESPDQATSGTKALAYKPPTGTPAPIRLTGHYGEDPVYGFGFMVTRLAVDLSISVYDDADNPLFDGVVAPNGNGFSWFGYQGDTDIGKIVMISSQTWQYWLDDISLTPTEIPEPATMALLGLGALAMFRRKRQ